MIEQERRRQSSRMVPIDEAMEGQEQEQQQQNEAGERRELTRHRSGTMRVSGGDAVELSSRLQQRRRSSVVGAGL